MTCSRLVVFSGSSSFPTNETDRHDIAEILLKAIKQINNRTLFWLGTGEVQARNMLGTGTPIKSDGVKLVLWPKHYIVFFFFVVKLTFRL